MEDEDRSTIGIFNSRLLRPHREAKLKPVARINMISVKRGTNGPQRKEIEEFCENLKENTESDKESQKVEILTGKSKKESKMQKEQQVQMLQQPGEGEDSEATTVILEISTEPEKKKIGTDK